MLGVPTPSFPAASSQQRQSGGSDGRNKVALRPGRSLMDWIKLTKGNEDIQGFRGRMHPVTLDELAQHKTVDDCWMAIRGQVYNVTHYMEYHPGGVDELMKGAGKDATELFEAVHKWVNYGSMLAKCLIGPLKYEVKVSQFPKKVPVKSTHEFLVPKLPMPVKDPQPRYEWYEKANQIVITVYIKQAFDSSNIVLDCQDGKNFDLKILLRAKFYSMCLELLHPVKDAVINTVSTKKVEIVLHKEDDLLKWSTLGKELPGHNALKADSERDLTFRSCTVVSVEEVTHDTNLFAIRLPPRCHYESPIGHHVKVKSDVEGVEVARSYTVALPSLNPLVYDENRGKVIHLMIKHYSNGTLTPTLRSLQEGSDIQMSDCTGTFDITTKRDVSEVFLICAGTGFTPMVRLMLHYLHQGSCRLRLLFANKQERDILWRDQLDDLVKKFPSRCHTTYILSEADSSWQGLRGRIDESVLKTFIDSSPFTSTDVSPVVIVPVVDVGRFFAICGPDQFTLSMKNLLTGNIGVSHSNIHCFMG